MAPQSTCQEFCGMICEKKQLTVVAVWLEGFGWPSFLVSSLQHKVADSVKLTIAKPGAQKLPATCMHTSRCSHLKPMGRFASSNLRCWKSDDLSANTTVFNRWHAFGCARKWSERWTLLTHWVWFTVQVATTVGRSVHVNDCATVNVHIYAHHAKEKTNNFCTQGHLRMKSQPLCLNHIAHRI